MRFSRWSAVLLALACGAHAENLSRPVNIPTLMPMPSLAAPVGGKLSARAALEIGLAGVSIQSVAGGPEAQATQAASAALHSLYSGGAAHEGSINAVAAAPGDPVEAAIAASGLAGRIDDIRRHSKGAVSIQRFMSALPRREPGYALGLSAALPDIQRLTGYRTWQTVYPGMFGRGVFPENHTDLFMEAIVRSDRPIVVLVPENYRDHPRARLTRDEIDWLLADPARMRNVTFVFGGGR